MPETLPVVLTIAGSDSSAGAGIQADLKTFAACGGYGVNAVTAIVAEAPGAVDAIQPVDSTLLGQQLNRVRSAFPIAAAKVGMLAHGRNVEAVTEFFSESTEIPLVVDPILSATAGGFPLLDERGEAALADLFPLATLMTPNLPEAEALLARKLDTRDEISDAPARLAEQFGCSVLLKGGHSSNSERCTDLLFHAGEQTEFSRERLDVPDLHGTGCTLSAAIAAFLARQIPVVEAVSQGLDYLQSTMRDHLVFGKDDEVAALNHFPNASSFSED